MVGFNSGIDQYKELGALMYFGSDENLAGSPAGERIAADGAKNPLCVIQAAGSVALEARCAGVKSKVSGTENIQVNGADDSSVVSTLQAKLPQTSRSTTSSPSAPRSPSTRSRRWTRPAARRS